MRKSISFCVVRVDCFFFSSLFLPLGCFRDFFISLIIKYIRNNCYGSAAGFLLVGERVDLLVQAHLYPWGRLRDLALIDAGHDVAGYLQEGGFYLAVVLRGQLDPLQVIVIGELPALLLAHFPLKLQVRLVANDDDFELAVAVEPDLPEPLDQVLEGSPPAWEGKYLVMS